MHNINILNKFPGQCKHRVDSAQMDCVLVSGFPCAEQTICGNKAKGT